MSIICIIPARKNSKRLKNKNIRILGNIPLVEWSINVAIMMKSKIEAILVTSDSDKILKIAKTKKIIALKRDRKLSKDNSSTEDVVLNAINWYNSTHNKKIKSILLLQPTSPFRDIEIIKNAIKIFNEKKLDNLFSVYPIKIKTNKNIYKFKNSNLKPNGNFYLSRLNFFLRNKNFFSGKSYGYILNEKKLNIDIDYKKDFNLAKKYI